MPSFSRTPSATLAISAALLALSAGSAQAQYNPAYNQFAQACMTESGPQQVDGCLAALRYEPANADFMRRLGDGMLAANRAGGAFDAYSDALALRPDMEAARQGRQEALRQITQRAGAPPVVYATSQYAPTRTVLVPVQPVLVPQPTAQPVAYNPFDGQWSGRLEPRGQVFAVNATIVGGHVTIFYEDSTDRVTLEGTVDSSGYFSGKGFLKDFNKSSGDGGEPLAISGRFTQNAFEGTGSAGSKATVLRLNRDS